ncbi:MAG TPA: TIGR00269 family protein [Candidatus Nanoarchaeia archaeon]|nr:TIGR00269 family protein [Candidatus Nanoarchaeia archaeon]
MACKVCANQPVYVNQNGVSLCKNHFIKFFEKKVYKTITQYKLIEKDDHIVVALSGGKDSASLLFLLAKLQYQLHFSLSALLIDEGIKGYREVTVKDAKKLCKQLKIPLKIISFKKETGKTVDVLSQVMNPCAGCGVLRRYFLNKGARLLRGSKVATGHNLDDEAQAFMMNVLKGNLELSAKLGPKSGLMEQEGFVARIKPFYFMLEKEVLIYAHVRGLPVTFIECPNTKASFRNEVGRLLNEVEQKYPGSKHGIVQSFLSVLPVLKKHFAGQKQSLRSCTKCGEPSVKDVCRACQILKR